MSTVDSILALLNKWPKWKRLTELPEKFDAMEARIKALEQKLSGSGDECPRCHQRTFQLINSKEDPLFGEVGGVRREYRCSSCNFEESKLITP